MDLKNYIEAGIALKTDQTELANSLGIHRDVLTHAKAGRRGLPVFACVKLAQLIDEVECRVIAASELVTETNPERRAVWLPFVQEIASSAGKRALAEAKSKARKISNAALQHGNLLTH